MILNAPWYISVPLISWFLNAAIGQGWICPWTALENKYRKKVGMPTIDTFVKHYYIKPYIRYKIRNKYKENGRKVIYRNMNKQCMELVKNTGAQLEYLIE